MTICCQASQRATAKLLGVGQATVSRDLDDSSESVASTDEADDIGNSDSDESPADPTPAAPAAAVRPAAGRYVTCKG
jgi:acetyl/propionyl-CoA carboxylase alpha subunit